MRNLLLVVIILSGAFQLQAQRLRHERKIFEDYFTKSSRLRYRAEGITKNHGYKHPDLKQLDKQIIRLDKQYFGQYILAMRKHGWLSSRMVGAKAARGFFLLIYNADTTQIKKYLPMAKKAVKQKRLSKLSYAQLYDQYWVLKGEEQYYGTRYYWDFDKKQYFYHKIAQIEKVNQRRTALGLKPLELGPPGFLYAIHQISLIPVQQNKQGYADTVLSSYYSGAHADFNQLYGGNKYRLYKGKPVPTRLREINPHVVIKDKNKFVSLPNGSYVIVGFGDNTVIDAPGQPDLFIEETGPAGDQAKVFVSADGKNFVLLGIADDGKQTTFDLADIGFKKPVVAVKVMGIDFKGSAPGFDLVSVRAMLGAVGEADPTVPWYIPSRLPDKLRNVLFAFDQWNLTTQAKNQITQVVSLMKKHPEMSLNLIGHTDLVGRDKKNLTLSQKRVEAVYSYMVAQGVAKDKLHKKYFGKRKPIYQDENKLNQALNRRVEFKLN